MVNAADGSLPLGSKDSGTPRGRVRDAVRDGLPAAATGGILDVDAGTWSPLPERPPRVRSSRAGDPVGWLDASGGPLAALDGWVFDPRGRAWAEPGPVPSPPDGLRGAAVVWAGDRLLVWANARDDVAPDGDGSRTTVDNVGWTWTPDTPSPTPAHVPGAFRPG